MAAQILRILTTLNLWQGSHFDLTRFLRSAFPSLKQLRLTGWFNTTGSTFLASSTFSELEKSHPELAELLRFLRTTEVVELCLEDAPRRGGRACWFGRKSVKSTDWQCWS